jgi:hypothetical protein
MAQNVRMELVRVNGRAALRGHGGVLADQPLHGIAAEPPPGAGRKQWLLPVSGAFTQPDLQDRFGCSDQGNGPMFAALPGLCRSGSNAESRLPLTALLLLSLLCAI